MLKPLLLIATHPFSIADKLIWRHGSTKQPIMELITLSDRSVWMGLHTWNYPHLSHSLILPPLLHIKLSLSFVVKHTCFITMWRYDDILWGVDRHVAVHGLCMLHLELCNTRLSDQSQVGRRNSIQSQSSRQNSQIYSAQWNLDLSNHRASHDITNHLIFDVIMKSMVNLPLRVHSAAACTSVSNGAGGRCSLTKTVSSHDWMVVRMSWLKGSSLSFRDGAR